MTYIRENVTLSQKQLHVPLATDKENFTIIQNRHVDWHCHYPVLVQATILWTFNGHSIPIMPKGHNAGAVTLFLMDLKILLLLLQYSLSLGCQGCYLDIAVGAGKSIIKLFFTFFVFVEYLFSMFNLK